MRLPKQIKSLQKPPNDASLTWADFTPATSGPWSVMLSKPTDTCQHHRLLSGVAGTRHSMFHLKCKEHPLGPVTAALCPQVGGWPARRAAVQPGYAVLCPHAWCEPAARSAGDETRKCGADPSSPATVRTRGHARAAAMRRQDAAG